RAAPAAAGGGAVLLLPRRRPRQHPHAAVHLPDGAGPDGSRHPDAGARGARAGRKCVSRRMQCRARRPALGTPGCDTSQCTGYRHVAPRRFTSHSL
ncbi:hypothetical protein MNEG_11142, partial [Monoraphidium neglectum]